VDPVVDVILDPVVDWVIWDVVCSKSILPKLFFCIYKDLNKKINFADNIWGETFLVS
jgi:hypothetical protein